MAAGGELHRSSNMAFLLQDNGLFSPSGFLGSWPHTTGRPLFRPIEFEEIGGGGGGGGGMGEESDECSLHQAEKKRRLTAEQAQFLEQSFEFENKLEPERKLQLAQALGLKPRQVAIWFQNRRARWKTKQLEKEFEALKSSYETLKIDHDSLLKEKDELESQVHSLTKRLLLRDKERNKKKEKDSESSFEFNKSPISGAASGFLAQKHPLCKQELDMASSANSTVLDAEIDGGGGYSSMLVELTGSSAAAFEIDNPDSSQIDATAAECGFLGIHEDDSEQGLWLWS